MISTWEIINVILKTLINKSWTINEHIFPCTAVKNKFVWLYINFKHILIPLSVLIYIVITDVCNDNPKEQKDTVFCKSEMQNTIPFSFFFFLCNKHTCVKQYRNYGFIVTVSLTKKIICWVLTLNTKILPLCLILKQNNKDLDPNPYSKELNYQNTLVLILRICSKKIKCTFSSFRHLAEGFIQWKITLTLSKKLILRFSWSFLGLIHNAFVCV